MQTRRSATSFGVEDSRQLFDLFTIHKHRLDMEAAGTAAKSQGRISPSIKSKAQLHRTLSRVRSQSMASFDEYTDTGSKDSDDTEFNSVSGSYKDIFAAPSPKRKEGPKAAQMNVFKRSLSNNLALNDSAEGKPRDTKSRPLHEYASKKPSDHDCSDEESVQLSVPPQVDDYTIDKKRYGGYPTKSPPFLRPQERKKREIIVKENSNLASKMKLDPSELDENEREAFLIKHMLTRQGSLPQSSPFEVDNDDEARGGRSPSSLLSRQSSKVGSTMQRQNSHGGLSRQNSGATTSPNPLSRQSSTRTPISRSCSSVTNMKFPEDDSEDLNFFKKYEYGGDGNCHTSSQREKSKQEMVEEVKYLQVRKRAIQERIESTGDSNIEEMEKGLELEAGSSVNKSLHFRSNERVVAPKYNKPVLVENVLPTSSTDNADIKDNSPISNTKAISSSSNMSIAHVQRSRSSSPISAKHNSDLDNHDSISSAYAASDITNPSGHSTSAVQSISQSVENRENYSRHDQVSRRDEVSCTDHGAHRDAMSQLDGRGYTQNDHHGHYNDNGSDYNDESSSHQNDRMDVENDSLRSDHSHYLSLEASQSEFGYMTGDISTGPSLNPGSLSKYSHHLSREHSFSDSVENYVSDLPENIAALVPRTTQKNKVCVSVNITPKMVVAKDVIEKKQMRRKIIQDRRFLKEARKATSHLKKRGQTPMQRIVASQYTNPNAPGKYAVPISTEKTEQQEQPNIEYLMKLVARNTKYKKLFRKTDSKTLAIDVGMNRKNGADEFMCNPPSPETVNHTADNNSSVFSLTSQDHLADDAAEEENTAKVLDLFNMKKGLIRCTYLNLKNAQDLPEFIYISRRGTNSLAERISSGSAYVTEWDRFLINFVKIVDSHIDRAIRKMEHISLKDLMAQLSNLPSACSREQKFRQLCLEFSVVNIGDRIDELHILGEIYRKREKMISKIMKETAAILERDIVSKKSKILADSPSIGSDPNKFPTIIDDSQSVKSVDSTIGSASVSSRKAMKSRKKWVKKLCVTAQPAMFGSSVTSKSSEQNDDVVSVMSSRRGIGNNSRRDKRVSTDGTENGSQVSNSSSFVIPINPITDGSVSLSCNQSHSVTSLPNTRSLSATTRRGHNSMSSMPPPSIQQPYFADNSMNDSSALKTKGISGCSTVTRPHTALNTLSFYKESVCDVNDSIYYHNDSPYVPWVPTGGMKMMISDKTDVLDGWRERRAIGDYVETTRNNAILRRSNVIKDSFESFTKMSKNFASRSVDLTDSHHH